MRKLDEVHPKRFRHPAQWGPRTRGRCLKWRDGPLGTLIEWKTQAQGQWLVPEPIRAVKTAPEPPEVAEK
jgi:hypothetical protein